MRDGGDLRQVSCQREEVGADDGSSDIAGEATRAAPGASVEAEGASEEGDPSLDVGAEVPEPLVNPVALDHVQDLEAALLGGAHVLDVEGLSILQVCLGRVAAIEGDLPRHPSVDLLLALDGAGDERGVGGVAVLDDPVQDEPRSAARQRELVSVMSRANP